MPRYAAMLLVLCPALAPAQKKPVTLDALYALRGRDESGPGMPLAWAPDGRTFLIRRDDRLAIYDPATKKIRDLADAAAMDGEAAQLSPQDGPFTWQDRRQNRGGPEFSASGRELLYPGGGDLFVVQVDTGKWKQLTKTPLAETDARISPDGKLVAFRRGQDIYTVDAATGKETRLTSNGSETLRNGGLDWVYPEELELDSALW
ncbi:MAG TPA: DPP IV N-terminal domain-containing protein, partial [Bryobacteraceae bacterium]|nr:DPP IV N-terminal domain-containing protein [Bryobacteraceae bacterium]